ncbi:alpha/beta hydrolase [Rhodococcus sp. NPDC127528]|uniref:alpha/beta hydrolase n=1 Tax=unclassified Rhodococcus (in: high G+C Gram-positive bacteria) TaxID=192944 RepID=UPI003644AA6F
MARQQSRAVRFGVRSVAVAVAVVALHLDVPGAARADSIVDSGRLLAAPQSPDGSSVERLDVADARHLTVYVHSTAMNRSVPVQVQQPPDASAPRPSLYLLNGAGGGVDGAQWRTKTDALEFLADKNVNVVSPVGGAWSYYTDWRQADPVLGLNKWTTFLTKELPPIVNSTLGTNGVNVIAGLSSSGTAALALAESAPGLYQGVASYSGCAQTSDPIGQRFVKLTVEAWGGGNTLNMYGPPDDPMWAANDPYIHADRLRGLDLYISSGNGAPGANDVLNGPRTQPGVDGLTNQIAVGGAIEAATNYCTHNLEHKLNQLGIPAHFNFRSSGTHSWGYWQDDLEDSWQVIAPR